MKQVARLSAKKPARRKATTKPAPKCWVQFDDANGGEPCGRNAYGAKGVCGAHQYHKQVYGRYLPIGFPSMPKYKKLADKIMGKPTTLKDRESPEYADVMIYEEEKPPGPSVIVRANRYIKDIKRNPKNHCNRQKQAAKRYLKLKNKYDFDRDAVIKVADFMETMPVPQGEKFQGKNFRLQAWQCLVLCHVYGLKHKDNTRLTRELYFSVPKKNGKSTFLAILAGYHLLEDDAYAPEIMFAANSQKQAQLPYNALYNSIIKKHPDWRTSKALQLGTKLYTPGQYFQENKTGGRCMVLPKNIGVNLDGYNVSFALVDEIHGMGLNKDDTFNLLRKGTFARENGLIVAATTAGYDPTSLGYNKTKEARDILDGKKKDNEKAVFLWEPDKKDKPKKWRTVVKTNPSLGTLVPIRSMKREFKNAQYDSADMREFQVKNLNWWLDSKSEWLDMKEFVKCRIKEEEFDPKGHRCYGGLDLSVNNDLTSLTFSYEDEEGDLYSKTRLFLPQNNIESNDWYAPLAESGYLIPCGMETIDYEQIENEIKEFAEHNDLAGVGFDSFQGEYLASNLRKAGITTIGVKQNGSSMNAPMEYLRGAVKEGKFHYVENHCFEWCIGNCIAKQDGQNGIKPYRNTVNRKIDGAVSQLVSMRAMTHKTLEKEKKEEPASREVSVFAALPPELLSQAEQEKYNEAA